MLACNPNGAGFTLSGTPQEALIHGPAFESYSFKEGADVVESMNDEELEQKKLSVQILVDTGSYFCCIDDCFAQRLKIPVIGTQTEQGKLRNIYKAAIWLPDGQLYTPKAGFLGYETSPHSILLGRPFLLQYLFECDVYNGTYKFKKTTT
ncbi:hypothetical protein AD940_01385 [Gluconobacter thailandicus]|uniref:hypothetical protein n=1 Tax=Gluconobacter thailandicus TaxID=257438 RepID=UPI0007774D4D|nr:hypothetical protein [Gluconobacter thailandicus]KXV35825.1 hypothetical protein AD940_01385 [Gluconobacter thailandicus]